MIDVTEEIVKRYKDGKCALGGFLYNDIFTDPIPNVQKYLSIEGGGLSHSIRIAEDTNVIIDMRRDVSLDTVIIYCGDDSHPSHRYDMRLLRDEKIYRVDILTEEYIRQTTSNHPDSLLIIIGRYDHEDPSDCDYVISHLHHLIRLAEVLPSVQIICGSRYTDGSLSSSSFCVRSNSVSSLYEERCTLPHHAYMEWRSVGFNISNMCSTNVRRTGTHNKFLKIDPILHRYGLLNQLNNICNSLVLGARTGRDVIQPIFYTHYNSPAHVPFSYIVDIYQLNNYLKSQDIWVRMVPPVNDLTVSAISDIESMPVWYSSMEDMKERISPIDSVVNIGCSMPNILRSPESIRILANIKFSDVFYSAAKYSMNDISDYCCLHLRLEDDWISLMHAGTDFDEMTQTLLSKYENALSSLPERMPIYICTGLGKSFNRNNYILDMIKEKYPQARSYRPWRKMYDLPEGREIDAIVDYIIGSSAVMMIGDGQSTFSLAVASVLHIQNKKFILI